MKKSRRNQKAEIPKNSPSPPHTPATTRLRRERLSWFLVGWFIFLSFLSHCYIRKTYEKVAGHPPVTVWDIINFYLFVDLEDVMTQTKIAYPFEHLENGMQADDLKAFKDQVRSVVADPMLWKNKSGWR